MVASGRLLPLESVSYRPKADVCVDMQPPLDIVEGVDLKQRD
ncbi:hypothetical protein J2T47_005102 [Pseudomonas nitroreducens]|nr:hypothetical protein [Pseudomonas nitroreducens]